MARATKSKRGNDISLEYRETEHQNKHKASNWLVKEFNKRGTLFRRLNSRLNFNLRPAVQSRKSSRRLTPSNNKVLMLFPFKPLTAIDISRFLFIMKSVINNIIKKGKLIMLNKNETTEETPVKTKKSNQKWYKNQFVLGILGICVALAVISITYSTAMIILGTEKSDLVPKIMVAPQAALALVLIGIAFNKLFK